MPPFKPGEPHDTVDPAPELHQEPDPGPDKGDSPGDPKNRYDTYDAGGGYGAVGSPGGFGSASHDGGRKASRAMATKIFSGRFKNERGNDR